MSEVDYYRSQADRCRRLIRVLEDPDAEQRLSALAQAYDRRARSFAARERRPDAFPPSGRA